MKKLLAFAVLIAVIASCNNSRKTPDISGVKVNVDLRRFDKDLFAIDTANIPAGLNQLQTKYPDLTPLFIQYILGLDNASAVPGIKEFIRLSQPLRDTVNVVFRNTDELKKEFEYAFRYVKYYFPDFNIPAVTTVVGPVDALAQSNYGPTPNFLRPGFIGISLQFYLGKKFSVYHDPSFIENVAPAYRSRRFSKEYIIADAMQLIADDLFPYKSGGKPLVEQMIERGKQWWLLDQFLPEAPDSIKTGYTQDQLNWCNENEGLIWSYIIKNDDLHSINPTTIQTYIGEAPFTQGFSQEQSPGNLGQWIGWQIVKKFVANNTGIKPGDVMNTPATKILDEAKYKPK